MAKYDERVFPVISDPADLDPNSGGRLERMVFNHRILLLLGFMLLTIFLGLHASRLEVNASFDRMIPSSHPYIQNFLDNRAELSGLGNSLRVVVENTEGSIYDAEYQKVLREVYDRLTLIRGVDRPWIKSLWAPTVRWSAVTKVGIEGGPVMPDRFDGSAEAMEQLRINIGRAGIVGELVGDDHRSSAIIVPLLDRYADTGEPLDYFEFSRELEQQVRSLETGGVNIRVIGFAKLIGDLIDGLFQVMLFFAVSVLIAGALVFLYTRCVRSTVLLVCVALLGVVWLLGVMELLGYVLDPYSILVPFLIFAIGLSHGAQKMNGVMQDVGRGTHKYVAARYTFRRLFMAGLTALLANVVGFAVLMVIDIPVIKDLAFATSVGVSILILTKLILIPLALSYIGVSPKAAARSLQEGTVEGETRLLQGFWDFCDSFTDPKRAKIAVSIAGVLAVCAFTLSFQVEFGDLDPGAPELRPESRYNIDNAYITTNYGVSSDQFAVIVKTEPGECASYEALLEMGRLEWKLRHVPGVQSVSSLYGSTVNMLGGLSEGSPKWAALYEQRQSIGQAVHWVYTYAPDTFNVRCSITPVVAYLSDHKAETLDGVLAAVEEFAAEHDRDDLQFLPAAGSAGIAAVTNEVVRDANWKMLLLLYSVTSVLCFITFRSWRAVVVAIVPLMITSIIAEALMVIMGIGIKVATLPVIALGVGIGVDYALYLLNIQLARQRAGDDLKQAYRKALMFTGKVVGLIGITMAAGVVTWAWSPIKFQADMGILLTFMFLWNMFGALILIPALSHFLLRGIGDKPAPPGDESDNDKSRVYEAKVLDDSGTSRHAMDTV